MRKTNPKLERQAKEFIGHLDVLADLLRPRRRPENANDPECSPMELRALAILGRQQPVMMSELAGALEVPLSSATHTIDKLVRKGLVERRRIKKDRRIVQVGFSKKGRQIHEFVVGTRMTAGRRLLEALTLGEREIFIKQLAKIAHSWE